MALKEIYQKLSFTHRLLHFVCKIEWAHQHPQQNKGYQYHVSILSIRDQQTQLIDSSMLSLCSLGIVDDTNGKALKIELLYK